jgi:hypothetical protein
MSEKMNIITETARGTAGRSPLAEGTIGEAPHWRKARPAGLELVPLTMVGRIS